MRPTEPFRREHRQLLSHIEHIGQAAGEVARLDHDERELLINRILDFLRGTLVPHAKAEEEVLYPEWASWLVLPTQPSRWCTTTRRSSSGSSGLNRRTSMMSTPCRSCCTDSTP
jgi:Hemerythrin HHE cation binding domain